MKNPQPAAAFQDSFEVSSRKSGVMPDSAFSNSFEIMRELLHNFPRYVHNRWVQLGESRGYFGDGDNQENGIRTNANVLYTAAVLVAHAEQFGFDHNIVLQLTSCARSVLKYLTDSHQVGEGACANGGKWGLEWQSSWWSAKIALAARELWPHLDESERERVHRIIVAEASRQVSRIIPTGLFGDTKAEENAWDCEILACALAMIPDHPDLQKWEKKLREFSANVFSSPHDRVSSATLDGEAVRQIVYTCNIHGDYSLENHGAFHFCYVASPLLSKAWSFFALTSADIAVPQALYHNVKEVWELAQKLFLTNRFAYVGGQDWARYTYGEYFIVPALIFLAHHSPGGPELEILSARLRTLVKEARGNDDGSFFGLRFTKGHYHGQYAKYETDCFCCLALAWSLCKLLSFGHQFPTVRRGTTTPDVIHISPEGQFWFARGSDYFASLSWMTLTEDVPNVTYLGLGDDSLAEWHPGNLIGVVKTLQVSKPVWIRSMKLDGANLVAHGTGLYRDRRGRSLYEHFLKVQFDLNSKVLRIHSKHVASSSLWFVQLVGLAWRVPNDIFNGCVRRLKYQSGSLELRQVRSKPATEPQSIWSRVSRRLGFDGSATQRLQSKWVNIDERIGLVICNHDQIFIRRFSNKTSSWKSLSVEQFEAPRRRLWLHVGAGKVLLETNILLHLGTARQTSVLAQTGE